MDDPGGGYKFLDQIASYIGLAHLRRFALVASQFATDGDSIHGFNLWNVAPVLRRLIW